MLPKRMSNILGSNTGLTNVIQVMLFRRILPCQLRASPMWEFNPEEPQTLKLFFGTMHEDIWKQLFKAQKNSLLRPRTSDLTSTTQPQR